MFKRFAKDERGFTLMELLIAVAIVVVLAAVGIPIYLQFQAGAKHSEASTNLNGIKLSEESFKLTNGTYQVCAQHPAAAPDETTQDWTGNVGFDAIGFSTSSAVRFVYAATPVSGSESTQFVAEGLGDTDGDGTNILFVASENEGPHLVGTGSEVNSELTLGQLTDIAD